VQNKKWQEEDKEQPEAPEDWEAVAENGAKPKNPANNSTAKPAPKPAAKPKGKTAHKEPEKPPKPQTKEEEASAKQRAKDEEQKSDFANAKDLFSGIADTEPVKDPLAAIVPITDSDFVEFANKLNEKVQPHKSSYHFAKFAKQMLRNITSDMKTDEVKDLIHTLNAIYNDKIAAEKAKDYTKGKPKKKIAPKKKLNVNEDIGDDDEEEEDEFAGNDELDAFK